MKVAQLIEELQKLNPEAEVVMGKDAEGNDHTPLAGVWGPLRYLPRSTWSGEVWDPTDAEESEDRDEDDLKKSVECVLLGPTN